ncbi:hypothetical protein CDD80_75 [Ophiocordyceps camponoti-rufipedis]|uniref:EF-hand domain-containing protein n=1 Tax=Ophiocordyceps camponoti-rufipedis TaxID=2004952 RepID=A0A2C5ZI75_9HYPO|nr:hypothetical protein CDD80_75 [Ophiocordyceps camponoti-rufipedis]
MNSHATPRPFALRSAAASSQQQSQQRPAQAPPPQAPSSEEYSAIAEEDREHIDEVFDLMDMKKKGWLNSYEFKHALAALGFDLPKPQYFHELETHGSVPPDWRDQHSCPVNRLYMYLDQFRLCAAKLISSRDPREEATKVFNMFDYDQDGIISFDDMRHLAQDIKEDRVMTDEEIHSMIEYLDHDGKGGVNLEEFIQMMEEAG